MEKYLSIFGGPGSGPRKKGAAPAAKKGGSSSSKVKGLDGKMYPKDKVPPTTDPRLSDKDRFKALSDRNAKYWKGKGDPRSY